VVPPPPSIDGVGSASGRGRGNGLTDNALGVVPPAPSARNDDFGFFGPADVRAALDRLSPGTYKDTRIERHLAHFAPEGEDVPDGVLYAEARPQGRRYRFRNPLMQPYVVLQGVSSGRVTREMLE